MAILSNRAMGEIVRVFRCRYGLRPRFVDLSGKLLGGKLSVTDRPGASRQRDYALQQSVTMGEPWVCRPVEGLVSCVVAMEDCRMVHGGVVGPDVLDADKPDNRKAAECGLACIGVQQEAIERFLEESPAWEAAHLREAADFLQRSFYEITGWQPELMKENRLRALQNEQINQAIVDLRREGKSALYAFEKERLLLSSIRAGNRNEARRILNEMLAAIYMSSPQLVVLRARTIELMSCLTRAAIEDNPLMEPLIERNHAWTERLIGSSSFEQLSHALMQALDDFIDGIYLHGVNRSNPRVSRALDYIGSRFQHPITLQEVADEVGLSVSRLSHLVKRFTGRTVVQIINEVRVRHAQQLLERSSMSCTEIAYDCGFSDQSYFIKQFRRLTGTTPARYRRAQGAP